MSRSTHSDLARILRDHAAALAKLPAGVLCADASSRNAIDAAAAALAAQDERIGAQTVALAAARSALRRLLDGGLSLATPGAAEAAVALELVLATLRAPAA